jgi:hypothetical protein
MRRYIDKSGHDAITHYEHGIDSIKVRFASGHEYEFTHGSAGETNVNRMKQLSVAGSGLTSFIAANQPAHARKSRV